MVTVYSLHELSQLDFYNFLRQYLFRTLRQYLFSFNSIGYPRFDLMIILDSEDFIISVNKLFKSL